MMVDLCQKAGYPAVSRAGLWRKPPAEETKRLREFMREHPSPEKAYSEGE
jgi:hypothetical protein